MIDIRDPHLLSQLSLIGVKSGKNLKSNALSDKIAFWYQYDSFF